MIPNFSDQQEVARLVGLGPEEVFNLQMPSLCIIDQIFEHPVWAFSIAPRVSCVSEHRTCWVSTDLPYVSRFLNRQLRAG